MFAVIRDAVNRDEVNRGSTVLHSGNNVGALKLERCYLLLLL